MAMSVDEWFEFIDQLRTEAERYSPSAYIRWLLLKSATEFEDNLRRSGIRRSNFSTNELPPLIDDGRRYSIETYEVNDISRDQI